MKNLIYIIFMTFFLTACNTETAFELKSGDILFTGIEDSSLNSGLSQAIDGVTQTHLKTHYTHMGIAHIENDTVWVIHAEPKNGVNRELLDDFLTGRGEASVYRLHDDWQFAVKDAIEVALSLIGQPYDYAYLIGGDAHYCSGFIYTIFEPAGIFDLEPMTFIDPETADFHKYWAKHYKKLGIDIPEGEPGCNPNGMALSPALYQLGNKILN